MEQAAKHCTIHKTLRFWRQMTFYLFSTLLSPTSLLIPLTGSLFPQYLLHPSPYSYLPSLLPPFIHSLSVCLSVCLSPSSSSSSLHNHVSVCVCARASLLECLRVCVWRGGGYVGGGYFYDNHCSLAQNETMNYAMLSSYEPHTHVHTYKPTLGTTNRVHDQKWLHLLHI